VTPFKDPDRLLPPARIGQLSSSLIISAALACTDRNKRSPLPKCRWQSDIQKKGGGST
jgi:hypothetical protein